MRQIVRVAVLTLLVAGMWLTHVPAANACANWCDPYCAETNIEDNSCARWVHECGDTSGCGADEWSGTSCPANYYACNDGAAHGGYGSCCLGGEGGCECGTKADGSCKPCGGFQCNTDYFVNCAGTKTTELDNSNNCISTINLNSCGVGSSQSIGSCCSETVDDQGNQICTASYVNTYKCCPTGTTVSCVDEYKTISFYRAWQDGSSHCGTLGYHVVSVVNNPNDCVLRDVDGDGEKETYCGRWFTCESNEPISQCTCNACNSTAPSGTSVAQGASATSADVSWVVGSGGASQRLYVDESQTEVNNGCSTPNACEVNATLAASTNTYLVTGLLPATTYYFRVATYENDSCTPSEVVSYTTPDVTLSGRVYLDEDNNCSTSLPWSMGSLTVSVRGTAYSGNVGNDGRFGFYGGDTTPIDYLDLAGYGSGYIPSTSAGCNDGATLTTVSNPSSTNYYYLTPRREAWWQAVGASVYAEGNVRSELPTSSLNLIEPGIGGAIGALMRSTGSVDTGAGAVSTPGYSVTTEYRGKTMNYDYFAAHMGVTPNTVNNWAADTMNKPANDPDKVFYFINPSGSEASVSTPWTVAAGESYVVFVNGDLRIASNITVADGGFLAFIVNGNLRVSPAVTDVAGLYVIDSSLITESNGGTDVAANFQGSVVAWGGVNLGRDLIASNLNQAGEKFTYRPDLLNNMPDAMKVFAIKWEEVVPGTFDQ